MVIDTADKLEEVKPQLLACSDPCVDVETTGLDIFGTHGASGDQIIGIAIDIGGESFYFPFRHRSGDNLPMECMDFFRSYLSDASRTYIGYNYRFDLHMMKKDGIEIAPHFEDAMLALHLINENEESFKLKQVCDKYSIGDGSLQESILEERVITECKIRGLECSKSPRSKNNAKSRMCILEPYIVAPYAEDDVKLTRELMEYLRDAMNFSGMLELFRQICYYSYIVVLMEERGMKIDPELIYKYQKEAETNAEDACQRLNQAAGFELNPNSSKKVCEWLEVQSSAAEELIKLIDAGGEPADRARLVQEARGWKSVNSKYYTPYLESMDSTNSLHCSLNLTGTYTGRLSCSKPNLQAVARATEVFKVKDVFVARPGMTLIQADYKQAEMRLVTHYTKDQTMRGLIESNADLHTATAEMLDIPRNAAKRINFSVIYGIGAKHLAENLRVDVETARDYLERYHKLYPGFRKLMNECEEFAKSHGYIEMWSGRIRHFDENSDPHKAMSNLIQGGVAEIVRVAISRLFPAISDIGGYLLLQVHDSVMLEVPDDQVTTALRTTKIVMEDFDFVPAVGVDIEYGKSWGALEEWEDR